MSAVNPYAPPQASVDDVHDNAAAVQPVRFFSPKGRINRLRYLAYFGASYLLFALVIGIAAGLGAATGSPMIALILSIAGGLLYGLYGIFISIQRSHDMGWSGWSILAALIPFVGLVWLFNPGTAGANRFGGPPPPNTTGVRIMAWLFPAIFIIGIVAAIALPAYQDYTKRARAVQVR